MQTPTEQQPHTYLQGKSNKHVYHRYAAHFRCSGMETDIVVRRTVSKRLYTHAWRAVYHDKDLTHKVGFSSSHKHAQLALDKFTRYCEAHGMQIDSVEFVEAIQVDDAPAEYYGLIPHTTPGDTYR